MKRTGFDNRELSWLKFNERVLEEAEDQSLPLCERLFFLSVYQTNLDEFFRVRVGSLIDQIQISEEIRENKTQMTGPEQMAAIASRVKGLDGRKETAYRTLKKELEGQGFHLVSPRNLKKDENRYVKEYFERELRPILSPQIVGKKQPFPFLPNGRTYVVVSLEGRGGGTKLGLISCLGGFVHRLISLPGGKGRYILTDDLIRQFAPSVFGNYNVKGQALLRITRNADIDPDMADEEDYRGAMEEMVRRRLRRKPVRVELSKRLPAGMLDQLCGYLDTDRSEVYYCRIPMDLSFVDDIRHILRGRSQLFYDKKTPQKALMLHESENIWQQVQKKDRLMCYPFESMKPFLQMLEEAAVDPDVISIKMTLYRLARGSKVAEALIEAAENGKEVLVLLELGARFDEENNIEWSRRLEEAGCRILYGLDGLKVHSKLCLVTARKDEHIVYLSQIGTGNYNEKTARQYTDLSYMTADAQIGAEVASIFTSLSLGQAPDGLKHLLAAPTSLQSGVLDMIYEQIKLARAGAPAYIGMKMNSLTDKKIIDALMDASDAGVPVDLIVRGSCCIVGGIPGKTKNIRVISIVGRFLEHSRIYIFGLGTNQKIYIGSADLMTRNTMRRVEVITPVTEPECRERLRQMFAILLADNRNCHMQMADGSYMRRVPMEGEYVMDSQEYFYRKAYERRPAQLPAECHGALCLMDPEQEDEDRKALAESGSCPQD